MGRKYGIRLRPIGLGVGGSNLLGLPDKDPIFKNRILIVDADTTVSQKARRRGNCVKMPCPRGVTGTARSPENLIISFLKEMAQAGRGPLHDLMLRLKVRNPSSDRIYQTFFPNGTKVSTKRDKTKAWWVTNWNTLKRWGVIELWMEHHPEIVEEFIENFERAVKLTSSKVR